MRNANRSPSPNQNQSSHRGAHGDIRNQHWLRAMAPHQNPRVPATNEVELGHMGCFGQRHWTHLCNLLLLLGFLAHLLETYPRRGIEQSSQSATSHENILTGGPQMNFAIVIFAGVMLLSAVNYFVSAHRKYTGPVATCEGRQEG